MSETPKFTVGQHVYLKESAALGFLETVRINGIYKSPVGWSYTVAIGGREPTGARFYGDRVSLINNSVLFFSEDEFVSVCEALTLAERSLQKSLQDIQSKLASLCPGTES